MKSNNPLLNVYLIITDRGGVPTIELRKIITMNEENKAAFIDLIKSTYNETPIVILPTFSNKLKSVGSMIENGWISEEKDANGLTQYKILF